MLTERIDAALHWAGLGERRRSLTRTLSGGMQRRLNIACSVLHEPQVLLLDEPTVGVDPQSRERIYAMLNSLLANGTAILLQPINWNETQTRCDRIAIVDAGQLLDIGTKNCSAARSVHHSRLAFALRTLPLDCPHNFASRNRALTLWDKLMTCLSNYHCCCRLYNSVPRPLNM